MTAETFDLAETLRMMRDPDLAREAVALASAMVANDTRHPAMPVVPVVPFAMELARSPERATAALLQLSALLVAAIGELALSNGHDPIKYLQKWALL